MSHRVEQVESSLQRAVSQIIQRELNDPRVRGLVSITRADVAPDFSQAQLFVSVLPAEHGPLSVQGLNAAAPHIRKQVRRLVNLHKLPRLEFRLDEGLKKEAEVYAAIAQGLQKEARLAPEPDPEATPSGDPAADDAAPADDQTTQE